MSNLYSSRHIFHSNIISFKKGSLGQRRVNFICPLRLRLVFQSLVLSVSSPLHGRPHRKAFCGMLSTAVLTHGVECSVPSSHCSSSGIRVSHTSRHEAFITNREHGRPQRKCNRKLKPKAKPFVILVHFKEKNARKPRIKPTGKLDPFKLSDISPLNKSNRLSHGYYLS